MIASPSLSQSELTTFQRCQRKYLYTYVDGIKPDARPVMDEGTLVHVGLATAYKLLHAPLIGLKAAAHAEMERVRSEGHEYKGEQYEIRIEDEDFERLKSVTDYYLDHYAADDVLDLEVLSVEKTRPVSFGGFKFDVTMDLVVRHRRSGIVQVFDRKTVGQTVNSPQANLQVDTQFLIYEAAAHELFSQNGVEHVEVVRDLIRRDVPPGYGYRPLTTKSGAKSSATTDPRDYLRREVFSHSKKELSVAIAELVAVGWQMRFQRPRIEYYRSVIRTGSEACSNCPHYIRCGADLLRGAA